MLKYAQIPELEYDFNIVKAYLHNWGVNGLAREQRNKLRHEKSAKALPPKGAKAGLVRLYCCLLGERAMVLGNGGHKLALTDRHQDSPHLKPHFDFFNRVTDAIDKMLAQRSLVVDGHELSGDLEIWL